MNNNQLLFKEFIYQDLAIQILSSSIEKLLLIEVNPLLNQTKQIKITTFNYYFS